MPPNTTDSVDAEKLAERSHRESARRLRAIFDRTFGFIGLLAPDGTLLEVNRTALEFIAARREDVLGRPFWETPWWDSGDARDRLRAAIARAAAGEFVRYEAEHTGADGSTMVLDFSLTPVAGDDGSVEFIIPEARDITDFKRAGEALRVSESKFSGIVAISADAIITIDESQSIIHFNRGAEEAFGYREAEVLGRPLEILIPEPFRAAHGDHVRTFGESPVAARRMGERREISGLRKDGRIFPAEASISKLDVDGSRIYTVVLRDISERKRAERAQRFLAEAGTLLSTSLDYQETIETIVRLAVPTLADWCIVYASGDGSDERLRRLGMAHVEPARHTLLHRLEGIPVDGRTPHPVLDVIRTGDACLLARVDDDFAESIAYDAEHRSLLRELGPRSALFVALAARGDVHGAVGFFLSDPDRVYGTDDVDLARDLAARAALAMDNARLYREARQAIRARDDVLSVVSHDLGNPLSAIRIGTTLLLKHLPPEELGTGGGKHLEGIRHSVEQMEQLIQKLLEVKRIESGHVALERSSHSAAALAAAAIHSLAPIAESRSILLEQQGGDDAGCVLADRDRILQVFSNLVGNALKFTPAGGRVSVDVAPDHDMVRFSVSDTGVGIDAESLPHVFDRFWQARKHRVEGHGIGLGLAIVKGIVEAHGGRVWVESEPGVGTTFYFTIPSAERRHDA